MKVFKRQQKIKDERIEKLQNWVFREVYYLVVILCAVSIAVKTYLYGYDIRTFITELVIIVVPSIYYGLRTIWLGIYWDELEMEERTSRIPVALKNVVIGLGFGIAMALFFGVRSSLLYGGEGTRAYYFLLVFAASLTIYVPFFVLILLVPYLLAKVRSQKIDGDNDEKH